jgi:hypothetical protein
VEGEKEIWFRWQKESPGAGSPASLFFYQVRDGLSRRVLSLHHHRHCAPVSFTAVLSMDVLQHCASGQRPVVSNAPAKVLDMLCVSAGKTNEFHSVPVSSNAVHNKESRGYLPALR